jgi:hypothetical protein
MAPVYLQIFITLRDDVFTVHTLSSLSPQCDGGYTGRMPVKARRGDVWIERSLMGAYGGAAVVGIIAEPFYAPCKMFGGGTYRWRHLDFLLSGMAGNNQQTADARLANKTRTNHSRNH